MGCNSLVDLQMGVSRFLELTSNLPEMTFEFQIVYSKIQVGGTRLFMGFMRMDLPIPDKLQRFEFGTIYFMILLGLPPMVFFVVVERSMFTIIQLSIAKQESQEEVIAVLV